MAFRVYGQVPIERVIALRAFVQDQGMTEHVFLDCDARGWQIADIVHMDEYTIDLVVPLPDGLCLVYDTT